MSLILNSLVKLIFVMIGAVCVLISANTDLILSKEHMYTVTKSVQICLQQIIKIPGQTKLNQRLYDLTVVYTGCKSNHNYSTTSSHALCNPTSQFHR